MLHSPCINFTALFYRTAIIDLRTAIIADRSLALREQGISRLFAHVTLTLTR